MLLYEIARNDKHVVYPAAHAVPMRLNHVGREMERVGAYLDENVPRHRERAVHRDLAIVMTRGLVGRRKGALHLVEDGLVVDRDAGGDFRDRNVGRCEGGVEEFGAFDHIEHVVFELDNLGYFIFVCDVVDHGVRIIHDGRDFVLSIFPKVLPMREEDWGSYT